MTSERTLALSGRWEGSCREYAKDHTAAQCNRIVRSWYRDGYQKETGKKRQGDDVKQMGFGEAYPSEQLGVSSSSRR